MSDKKNLIHHWADFAKALKEYDDYALYFSELAEAYEKTPPGELSEETSTGKQMAATCIHDSVQDVMNIIHAHARMREEAQNMALLAHKGDAKRGEVKKLLAKTKRAHDELLIAIARFIDGPLEFSESLSELFELTPGNEARKGLRQTLQGLTEEKNKVN